MDEKFNLELTREQAKQLCLILRKDEENSKFINDLQKKIESFLFDTMTIDEAENLFYEN